MLLIVPLELGGVLGMPSTVVDGIRNGTGIYTGLGRGSGVLVSGSWDSPGQLLRGVRNGTGIYTVVGKVGA